MDRKEFFRKYSSNTLAGTSNATLFDSPEKQTSYAFYRVFAGGKYNYSFLFSNVLDSSFGAEDTPYKTMCNDPGGEWKLYSARIIITKDRPLVKGKVYDKCYDLTFDGKKERDIHPGDIFCSDGIDLDVSEDEYLCYEVTYQGCGIPCHVENMIPCYKEDGEHMEWPFKFLPLPNMVGCDRPVKKKIGFVGDSISQGIGCPEDSYLFYTAICAKAIGKEYSFWNLAIGLAKAFDVASDGFWAEKAKQCDVCTVMFSANDLWATRSDFTSTKRIIADLEKINSMLKERGIKVLWQSCVPYNFSGTLENRRQVLIAYIRDVLSKKADAYFDQNEYITDKTRPNLAVYGEHPNEEACRMWGEHLAPVLKTLL